MKLCLSHHTPHRGEENHIWRHRIKCPLSSFAFSLSLSSLSLSLRFLSLSSLSLSLSSLSLTLYLPHFYLSIYLSIHSFISICFLKHLHLFKYFCSLYSTFDVFARSSRESKYMCIFSPMNSDTFASECSYSFHYFHVGYIGAKGIGFKSVFKVTDTPEIHSNGYHFRFDKNKEEDEDLPKMGYIVPIPVPPNERNNNLLHWNTTIILPLLPRASKEAVVQLKNIDPTVILFLKKVSAIEVVDESSEPVSVRTILRTKLPHQIVQLETNGDCSYYLLIQQNIKPTTKRNDERVESTTLSLAFPVAPEALRPPLTAGNQMCFAYLPVQSFGLKFIVQVLYIVLVVI